MALHERRDVEQEDLPVRAPAVQEQQRGAARAAGPCRARSPARPRSPASAGAPASRRPSRPRRRRRHTSDPRRGAGPHCAPRLASVRVPAPRRELRYQRDFHEHRDRHRLHAAPLLGPALRRGAAALRHRPALRRPGHVGDHAAAARAGPRVRPRDPLRGARARRAAVPRRGRDGRAWHRPATSSTSPRIVPPTATGDRALAAPDPPAVRRALLLLRQGRALPRDRHRRADRRLAGEPRARAGGRHHRGHDRCTPGTASCARPRT